MTHDELRLLAENLESWIVTNINSIVDTTERTEFILSSDICRNELFEPLSVLFDQAGSLYNIVLARIIDPLKGKGKGTIKVFIENIVREILGAKIKSRLAEMMDDSFDENELEMKKDELIYSLKNLEYILQHLKDVDMQYDKFFRCAFITKKPWNDGFDDSIIQIGEPDIGFVDAPGRKLILYPLSGYHATKLQVLLNNVFPAEYRWSKLKETCYTVANLKEFDTYQWFANNMIPEWDGIDRSNWLEEICGVESTHHAWNLIVGMKLSFVAMIARCFEPGIHSRVVLVFEGDQNIGKSRLAAEMAFTPDAFTKLDLSDGFKEAKRMIKGMAVVELADLGSVDIVNQNRMKDFISDENNRIRNMYQEDFDNEKRRSIFILTVNGDSAGFLVDTTGNTRFGVVQFKNKIDIEKFRAIKMQLWAQALHLYRQGMRPWLTDEETLLQEKTLVSAERYFREYELCEIFVKNNPLSFEDPGITTLDIIEHCKRDHSDFFSPTRTNRSYCSKFIKGMKMLGYAEKPFTNKNGYKNNNKPGRYWFKIEE